jgi:DNA-binding LytR/AlgR family response regulator
MSGHGLSVLAIDDEQPQLEDLARILRASPLVADVETAASAQEAVVKASRRRFDAVFADVRMPELDGLELARVLKAFANPPAVVFVSAFDTAAVAAFELRALDYLLKPVTPQRVHEALERVATATTAAASAAAASAAGAPAGPHPADPQAPAPAEAPSDVVLVDNLRGGGTRLLPRSSILYLQAYGDYMRVFADSGRYLVRGRLNDAEQRFRAHGFLRVHRQYLVNLRRAIEVKPQLNGTALLRFEDGSEIPVARRQVVELRRRLRT